MQQVTALDIILAEDEIRYHASRIQAYLIETDEAKRVPGYRSGIHRVIDELENIVVWESEYDDGANYESLSAIAEMAIRSHRAAIMAKKLAELTKSRQLRWADPVGDTIEAMRKDPVAKKLYQSGDIRLIWVNQGDLNLLPVHWQSR